MPDIRCILGDITLQEVDAIVNAANTELMGGGGVDGAIHAAGGPEILAACRELRRTSLPDGLPVGEAVATTAGDLPAAWVIHTVGPVYAGRAEDADLLARCHLSALRVADELGVEVIAFPAISTGVYGYPVEEAARVAMGAVRASATRAAEVGFVLFDRRTFTAFETAATLPA